jgi:hypothetical protein
LRRPLNVFLGVECWGKGDLTPRKLREIGVSLGLPSPLVEREIIFYDTLEAMCSSSPVPVVLKGGTLISRVYSEHPRFSWDIDLTAPIRSKDDYDLPVLNQRIEEDGRIGSVEIGGEPIEFGKFERDAEKDVFVDVLSLKRDMITLSFGAPLPTYLRKKGLSGEKLEGGLSKLKAKLGSLPFADSVRMTISLTEPPVEPKHGRIKSIIEGALKPTRVAKTRIYPPELCLMEKLSRISRGAGEIGLRDLLCDFYDIGQLLRLDLNEKMIIECFRGLYSRREIPSANVLRRGVRENLSSVRRNLDLFEKRREFTWCRYEWGEYFSLTVRGIERIWENLNRLLKLPHGFEDI